MRTSRALSGIILPIGRDDNVDGDNTKESVAAEEGSGRRREMRGGERWRRRKKRGRRGNKGERQQ